MKSKLSSETQKHLDYIANRLIAKRAVVMVGAGFSRNSDPDVPMWAGLADEFRKVLSIGKSENVADVLDLAEETQIFLETKGGPCNSKRAIDKLIEKTTKINKVDLTYHIRLLNLPWADVLTTNYDTLLEQARSEVCDYRYGLVLSCTDIPREYKPRIVKLHGSFKSDRKATTPYIITKEDYRTYPTRFASFVNTVRQDMMESTMCLVGFSGEDPNFLSWLGWVRDILGEKGPKVYLVGNFHIRETKVQLLESRNIFLVNFAPVVKGEADPNKAAMSKFLDYLHDKVDKNKWKLADTGSFCSNYNVLTTTQAQKRVLFAKLIGEWSRQRKTYPGWKVVPASYRDKLLWQIRMVSHVLDDTPLEDKALEVSLLYEVCWILSSIGFPMCYAQKWNKRILNVIEQGEGVTDEKTAYLALAAMTGYRYLGNASKWHDVASRLSGYTKRNDDIISQVAKEVVLYNIQIGDKVTAENVMQKWEPKSTWWKLQKFTLAVALNQEVDIGSELHSFLKKIRDNKLDEYGSERTDIASQEAVVLYLLAFFKKEDSIDSTLLTSHQSIERKDRLFDLKTMMCLVEDELMPLSRSIDSGGAKHPTASHPPFRVGNKGVSRYLHIKTFGEPSLVSLLYLMEQIGVPIQHNGRLAKPLITPELIAKHVFEAPLGIATHLLCSCGVASNAKDHFDRSMIIGIDGKSVDAIVKRLIAALDDVSRRWSTDSDRVPSFVIPIGRLCCKILDTNLKLRFAQILAGIFKQGTAIKDTKCIDEAIELLVDSLQVEEIKIVLPELFLFKTPVCNVLTGYAYKHPCDAFSNRWFHFLSTTSQDKSEYVIDWSIVREELNSTKKTDSFWAAKAAVLGEKLNLLPKDLHLRLLDFSKAIIKESPEKFITQMEFSFIFELLQKNDESVDVGAILSNVIESCTADIFDNCFIPILLYCHYENVDVSISAEKGRSLLESLSGRLKSACEKLTKADMLCGDVHAEFFRSNVKGEIYASYFKLLYLVDFLYRFGLVEKAMSKEIETIREVLNGSSVSTLGLDWFATKERKMNISVVRRICSDFSGVNREKSAIAYNCSIDIIERSWEDAEQLLSGILMSSIPDKTDYVIGVLLALERRWGNKIKSLRDDFLIYLESLRDAYEDDDRAVEERLRIARDAIRVRTIVVRASPTSDKPTGTIFDYWTSEELAKELPFAEINNAEHF